MRGETYSGRNEAWRARDAEALQHVVAERREGTRPIVMADSKADDRTACRRRSDQSGSNARPNS